MLFSLRLLLGQPEGHLSVDCSFDWRDLDIQFQKPAAEPVRLRGEVRSTAGVLMLRAVLTARLHQSCDRCLTSFEREFSLPVEAVLSESRESEENEEIVLIRNECVDLEELARAAFILSMDIKSLCTEDCAGLCAGCGQNLNAGPCHCEKETDPRWKALRDYSF